MSVADVLVTSVAAEVTTVGAAGVTNVTIEPSAVPPELEASAQ